MVNAIIRWCLNNRFLVVLVMGLLIAAGDDSITHIPIDAIPDIGEKQVIVLADWPGRSPQDVEDQVTYPLTVSLSGTPGVKTLRSFSGFGFTMVFVIFKDEVDYYWARSRVLERMNVAVGRLPQGVLPTLGADATALGQIFTTRSKLPEPTCNNCGRCRTGTSGISFNRWRESPKSRRSAATCASTRSTLSPKSCEHIASRCRKFTKRFAAATSMSARRSSRTIATNSSSVAKVFCVACKTSRTLSSGKRLARRSS